MRKRIDKGFFAIHKDVITLIVKKLDEFDIFFLLKAHGMKVTLTSNQKKLLCRVAARNGHLGLL